MTPQIWALATAILGSACFACFTWGTIAHFVRVETEQSGAWAISLLSLAGYCVFAARLAVWDVSTLWPAGWVLFCLSLSLWVWTIRFTRNAPPSLAFTRDAPATLFARGPYRLVRHPFYTSYLMFWAAASLAPGGAPLAVVAGMAVFLMMTGTYLLAARHEERKFADSSLAWNYRDYAASTGMFLPRPGDRLKAERLREERRGGERIH